MLEVKRQERIGVPPEIPDGSRIYIRCMNPPVVGGAYACHDADHPGKLRSFVVHRAKGVKCSYAWVIVDHVCLWWQTR